MYFISSECGTDHCTLNDLMSRNSIPFSMSAFVWLPLRLAANRCGT